MEYFNLFVQTYGVQIITAILTAIFGYVGAYAKKAIVRYTNNINDKIKRDVVSDCVKFVEQIYTDIHGREKLEKCIGLAGERLNEKGIKIGEVELWTMIEACVNEFNKGFNS